MRLFVVIGYQWVDGTMKVVPEVKNLQERLEIPWKKIFFYNAEVLALAASYRISYSAYYARWVATGRPDNDRD